MRWSIDWLLRKFYSLVRKLFSIFLKIIFWVLKSLFIVLYRSYFFVSSSLPVFLGPLYPFLCNSLVYLIDSFLFVFVSIPCFIYHELFKPLIITFYNFIIPPLCRYTFIFNPFKEFRTFIHSFLVVLFTYFKKIYLRLYKLFIDFLYFDIYRNRNKIFNLIHFFLINFVRFFLVYFFFLYKYMRSNTHLIFFQIQWKFCFLGFRYLFGFILCFDNIFKFW